MRFEIQAHEVIDLPLWEGNIKVLGEPISADSKASMLAYLEQAADFLAERAHRHPKHDYWFFSVDEKLDGEVILHDEYVQFKGMNPMGRQRAEPDSWHWENGAFVVGES